VTPSAIEAHFEELERALRGKDPRRLSSPARGRALLMLLDGDGARHRLTVAIGDREVEVTRDGASPDGDEAFTVIQARGEDWVRFFGDAGPETLRPIKLYGSIGLVSALGELIAQSRSAWDLRSGGAS